MSSLKTLAVVFCLVVLCQSDEDNFRKKLVLDVYYESLCPDCRAFIPNQLLPVTKALSNHLKVRLYPFGKAHFAPNGTITCQHGPSECYGNQIHACGLKQLHRSLPKVKFAACLDTIDDFPTAIKKCSALVGINPEKVEHCANGTEGFKLVTKYGHETLALNPRVYFVPTVAIDGYRGNPNDNFTSFQNLIDKSLITPVCQFLKRKHHIKPPACHNPKEI